MNWRWINFDVKIFFWFNIWRKNLMRRCSSTVKYAYRPTRTGACEALLSSCARNYCFAITLYKLQESRIVIGIGKELSTLNWAIWIHWGRGMERKEDEIKQKLQELQRQLGKKQSFEEAVSSIRSLLLPYYPSASPSLQKSVYIPSFSRFNCIYWFFSKEFLSLDTWIILYGFLCNWYL